MIFDIFDESKTLKAAEAEWLVVGSVLSVEPQPNRLPDQVQLLRGEILYHNQVAMLCAVTIFISNKT